MASKSLQIKVLEAARRKAGLSQRSLAQRARTAQSVVARIESGETSPTLRTLEKLVRVAGFELELDIHQRLVFDRQMLDDVPRIRRLSPEDRLREVANLNRLLALARRA
jgi:predicted transcriptional regulator